MPTLIIRRFPMPSVSIYLILSLSCLSVAVLWANNVILEQQDSLSMNKSTESKTVSDKKITSEANEFLSESKQDPNKNVNGKTVIQDHWSYPKNSDDANSPSSVVFSVKRDSINAFDEGFLATEIAENIDAGNYSFAYGVAKLMLEEPLCLLVVANATYCVLILLMQIIHRIVFGRLRPIERQHIKDKFWNFVFYKFIFIFGVMNVQSLNGVLIWVSWFTAIAFLLLLTKLSKDRFEFLSFSPNTPMYYHWKVVGLLIFILFCCIILAVSCITSTFPFTSLSSANHDIHSMTFMLAECTIIAVKVIHVLLKYSIHLYDVQHEELWERKATVVYHVDLVMELSSLLVNFIHHLHMLFSGNIWLSMASLVICMQLRFIFSEIQKRFLRHKNYRRVVANMEAQFPAATKQELEEHEDRCAICWDQMESARKLPCGHLFHAPCLRSWLEQDTTCPTCRKQLGIRQSNHREVDNLQDDVNDVGDNVTGTVPNPGGGILNHAAGAVGGGQHLNHFWHFDGSRFASWLPSFSVEVSHSLRGAQAMVTTTAGANPRNQEVVNSQLDAMVREVQEIFPQIPARIIANDLRLSGSVETTTNNILEGNITVSTDQVIPPVPQPPPANNQSLYQLPPFVIGGNLRRRNVAHTTMSSTARSQPVVLFPTSSTRSASTSAPVRQVSVTEEESEVDQEVEPPPTTTTPVFSRFSKAPEEREKLLQSRRDILVRKARLKYLKNKGLEESLQAGASTSDSNPPPAQSKSSLNSPRLSEHSLSDVAASSSQNDNLVDGDFQLSSRPQPEEASTTRSSRDALQASTRDAANDSDSDDRMSGESLD